MASNPDIDLILARAQVSMAERTLLLFGLCSIGLLVMLCLPSEIKAPSSIVSLVSAAIGSLGTILAQQNGFFYARHRQQTGINPPDIVMESTLSNAPTPTSEKTK